VDSITQTLIKAAECCFPVKRYRPYLKPYWNYGNVKQLHSVNRQKRKIWLEEGQPRGLESESYRDYKQAKRDFTNALRTAQRQYELEQIEHLQELAEIDIGLFFRALSTVPYNNQAEGGT
jgi:hypothetical protein